jgi:prepilin-type processing-associated H-X9-DG protein
MGGAHCWSTFILPYLDEPELYARFDFKQPLGVGANKPSLVSTVLPWFGCPSDNRSDQAVGGVIPGMATTNYVGNFGVGLPTVFGSDTTPLQGIFGVNSRIRFRDIKDGTSNVVVVGERCVPEQGSDWPVDAVEGRFNSYWFGIPSKSKVSPLSIVATVTGDLAAGSGPLRTAGELTALGTNDAPGTLVFFGINQLTDGTDLEELDPITAGFSSRHEGGCHVLLTDGSVRFISAEIDRRILVNLMRRSDGLPIGEF